MQVLIGFVQLLQIFESVHLSDPSSNIFADVASAQVLLLMWTQNIDLRMQVEMFELFAGQARVSQVCREAKRSVVSYDCLYDPDGKCMNFVSAGGFAQGAKIRLP